MSNGHTPATRTVGRVRYATQSPWRASTSATVHGADMITRELAAVSGLISVHAQHAAAEVRAVRIDDGRSTWEHDGVTRVDVTDAAAAIAAAERTLRAARASLVSLVGQIDGGVVQLGGLVELDTRTEDGTHVKVDAARTPEDAELGQFGEVADSLRYRIDSARISGSASMPGQVLRPVSLSLHACLNRSEREEHVVERLVDKSTELLRRDLGAAVQLAECCVVSLDESKCVGRVSGRDLNGVGTGHVASPSKGDGAEPGLASTVSVEGDPAAGAGVLPAPAVRAFTCLIEDATAELERCRDLRAGTVVNSYASGHANGAFEAALRALLNLMNALPAVVREQVPSDVLADAEALLDNSPTRTES